MPNQLKILSTSGISAVAAAAINGLAVRSLVATGNSAATALPLPASNNFFSTVAASTGAILPAGNPGDEIFVYNGGASALAVYAPVGGTVNGAASVLVTNGNAAYFVYGDALAVATLLGA